MRRALAWLLTIWLGLTLAGCGYHLRGVTALNPAYAKVFVQGMGSNDPVYQALANLFVNSNGALVTNPAEATATLVIDQNSVTQRVAVVTPQAVVQQYELYQQLRYHLSFPDGRRTAEQTLGLARNYNYDPVGVLASSGNEAQIRQELAESIAQRLFYRLMAAPAATP
ncbi:LPS assembly lipoprotein LptE [Halothiobacillus sp. DCM-1]|uniref:LPS-assembly lipoprotein LptE n=1 Tax=Halothiobacillus sp. DCM-1 TaxID=3112558 RepID=UPI00324B82DA